MRFLPSNRRSVTRCLTDCCLRNEPATVISPDSGIVCKGEFHQLDRDSVTVRLRKNAFPMLSESLCCVSFTYQQRPRAFFATILGLVDKTQPDIVLAIPSEIAAAERRHATRIQVLPESGLKAHVTLQNGKKIKCTAVNISTVGVLVDFKPEQMPTLPKDAYVYVTLKTKGTCVDLPARSVRRYERGYGLSFTADWQGDVDLHDELVGIVKDVENVWLRSHAHSGDSRQPSFLALDEVFTSP